MKRLTSFAIVLTLLSAITYGQSRPRPASVVALIASPEKFDGKLINVQGFLQYYQEKPHSPNRVFLFLHQEDAKNGLMSNVVVVVPSPEMIRQKERLDREYVTITGMFQAEHAAVGEPTQGGTIKDIQRCEVWSNPSRPTGERGDGSSDVQKPDN